MGRGQALYAEAAAGQVEDREARRWIAVFSDRAEALGGRAWTVEDVTGPAGLRLYLATASAKFVLGPDDERISVSLV
jgi:hypothetical protein